MVIIRGKLRELHSTSMFDYGEKYVSNDSSNYLRDKYDESKIVQTMFGWQKSGLVRVLSNYDGINRVEACPSAEARFSTMVNQHLISGKKTFGEGAFIVDSNSNLLGILKSMPNQEKSFLALNNVCDSMGYFSLFKGGIYSVDKRVCDFTTSILKSNCSADKYCSNFTPTIEVLGDFKVFPERFIQKSTMKLIDGDLENLKPRIGKYLFKI